MPIARSPEELKQQLAASVAPFVPASPEELLPQGQADLNGVATLYLKNHWRGPVLDLIQAMSGKVTPSPSGHPRIDAVKLAIHVKKDAITNGYAALGELDEYTLMHHLSVGLKRLTGSAMGTMIAHGALIKRLESAEQRERREAEAAAKAAESPEQVYAAAQAARDRDIAADHAGDAEFYAGQGHAE